jgi:DNA-binding FrmR family transcriptional regulator
MVDNEECCGNILVQIAAVRSAINKVGGIILENYTKSCIRNANNKGEENLDELIDTIVQFTRYYETK